MTRMTNRLTGVALLILLLSSMAALAQGTGQICVRSFEDRNANGTQDPGEPNLTRGVTADLQDGDGVIVASQLLENSPRASQGLLCFQNLEPGQYTVNVAAADYVATGASSYGTSISASTIPDVFEFGAQLLITEAPEAVEDDTAITADEQRVLLQRVLLAGVGAAFVIGVMVILGSIIFFLRFRNKLSRPARPMPATGTTPAVRTPTTGSMRPVTDSQQMQPVPPQTAQDTPPGGSAPVNPDDDTGRFRPPADADNDTQS